MQIIENSKVKEKLYVEKLNKSALKCLTNIIKVL